MKRKPRRKPEPKPKMFDHHHHDHHYHADPRIGELFRLLECVLTNQRKIMATLDQTLEKVSEQTTKLDSLSTFVKGLQQQIADALSGVTLPPAVQAKVDAVFEGVDANTQKVVNAMDDNIET